MILDIMRLVSTV